MIASSTVKFGRSSTYSVVIMLPAESSGYFRSSLMSLRVSGSACARIRFTTFAGISSTMSTASSMYSSSMTSLSSESEKPLMSSSWESLSISTKVSAASSFGSRRNSRGSISGSRSSNSAAISAAFIVTRMSRSVPYFLDSISEVIAVAKLAISSSSFYMITGARPAFTGSAKGRLP